MTVVLWILTPLLMYLMVYLWAMNNPDGAMSSVGNLRRRFRSWVWTRARDRYLSANKNSGRSPSSLLEEAKKYANQYTQDTLGEPGEAEKYWW